MNTLPLNGIKVLDLTRLLPGPFCSLYLADLGAEVIKVEEPIIGDYIRNIPPFVKKESFNFLILNRNKKSITLNLKREKAREIFYKLSKNSDIIIESFRPGVTKKLKIDYEQIKSLNPKIIYCSITGYGQDGPYRDKVGHDINYISYGGILYLTGSKDGEPIIPSVQIADIGGGSLPAVISILSALIHREKTSKGQYIDISMLDGVVSFNSFNMPDYFAFGKSPQRGNQALTGRYACYNIYETKDKKYISIGALEPKFWKTLCNLLKIPQYIDKQYNDEFQPEITSALKNIFKTKEQKEWEKFFANEEVCFGSVKDISEVFSDEQVISRNIIFNINHPTAGKIKQIKLPIRFSDIKIYESSSPPPTLGQNNKEILSSLGYSEEEIEKLKKENVI